MSAVYHALVDYTRCLIMCHAHQTPAITVDGKEEQHSSQTPKNRGTILKQLYTYDLTVRYRLAVEDKGNKAA
jgi:hypothetical protein